MLYKVSHPKTLGIYKTQDRNLGNSFYIAYFNSALLWMAEF